MALELKNDVCSKIPANPQEYLIIKEIFVLAVTVDIFLKAALLRRDSLGSHFRADGKTAIIKINPF